MNCSVKERVSNQFSSIDPQTIALKVRNVSMEWGYFSVVILPRRYTPCTVTGAA